jgi:hypothetical protein
MMAVAIFLGTFLFLGVILVPIAFILGAAIGLINGLVRVAIKRHRRRIVRRNVT